MTSILDGTTLTLKSTLQFYERRLKRLLPAYLLVILLTLAATSAYLISTDYEFLKTDAIWALGFGTNFQSMFEKETYFKLVSDYKFLLHTWSLSVEFQYYFLAPFILIPIGRTSNPIRATCFLVAESFLFQTFIPSSIISFGLVFSRLWQFLVGTLVYYYLKNGKMFMKKAEIFDGSSILENGKSEAISKKSSVLRLLNFFIICFICFMPVFPTNYLLIAFLRFLATSFGGIAIYYGHQQSPIHTGVIRKAFEKAYIYYGDISYSVYLIHWPIIILAKYIGIFDNMRKFPQQL